MTKSIGKSDPSATRSRVGVLAEAGAPQGKAERIAVELDLPLISVHGDMADFDFILEVGAEGLALAPTDQALGGRIRIDFVRGSTAYRRVAAGATRQPLAKAVGLRRGHRNVFDATAGLGRDAFLLACWGCRVTAAERSPILAAMLDDALQRAQMTKDCTLADIVRRIRVLSGDSRQILLELPEVDRPEVVYLDPMYVPRAASALAKKEMRILRHLVGGDEDASELFQVARQVARNRVVVKRHLRAPELENGVTMHYRGRSVRYDVYVKTEPHV